MNGSTVEYRGGGQTGANDFNNRTTKYNMDSVKVVSNSIEKRARVCVRCAIVTTTRS